MECTPDSKIYFCPTLLLQWKSQRGVDTQATSSDGIFPLPRRAQNSPVNMNWIRHIPKLSQRFAARICLCAVICAVKLQNESMLIFFLSFTSLAKYLSLMNLKLSHTFLRSDRKEMSSAFFLACFSTRVTPLPFHWQRERPFFNPFATGRKSDWICRLEDHFNSVTHRHLPGLGRWTRSLRFSLSAGRIQQAAKSVTGVCFAVLKQTTRNSDDNNNNVTQFIVRPRGNPINSVTVEPATHRHSLLSAWGISTAAERAFRVLWKEC